MAVIEVQKLNKEFKVKEKEKGFKGSLKSIFKPKYKKIKAVKNISFTVEKGEMVAFIGPNGAGKSTTIKMLTGILFPDKGKISVLGIDPTKNRKQLAYKIGTVFGQKEQLWTHLPPIDNFKFFGAVYDIPDKVVEKRIDELSEMFELSDILYTPVKNLSLGQRIKCEIAASLIHKPEILFLDEPTLGLDVIARKELWKIIESLKGKVTIILTTHYMEEAESLSDRIAIMNKGNIVQIGTAKELIEKTGAKNFEDAFVKIATGGEL